MVFYFSATGNSKYVATKLRDEFGGELVSVPEAVETRTMDYNVEDGEKVIFVFPIYYYGIPEIIENFIKEVNVIGKNFDVCAVCTCGGSPGGADVLFKGLCKEKGWNVKGFYKVKMVDNYVMLFKMPLPEEQIMVQRRSEDELKDVIDSINFNFRVSYKSEVWLKLLTKAAQSFFKTICKTKKFYAKDTCIGCGLCQEICPVNVIEMKNNKPTWTKSKCMHCTSCINRCPASAIEYGKMTVKKGRYVNPNVDL